MITPAHPSLRLLVGVVAGAVLLSAAGMIIATLTIGAAPSWAMLSFETITILGAAVALLFAGKKLAAAPALTLVCAGGSIGVATLFAYVGVRGIFDLKGRDVGVPLQTWLIGRELAAIVIAGSGAAMVLARDPRARTLFARGLAAGIPVAAVGAGLALRAGALAAWCERVVPSPWLRVVVYAGGAVALGTLACMSLHFIVRAFELGTDAGERADDAAR